MQIKRIRLLPAAGIVLFLCAVLPLFFGAYAEFSVTLAADRDSAAIGETITWTASPFGGGGAPSYTYFLFRDSQLVLYTDSLPDNTYRFTPTQGGQYRAGVAAKDGADTALGLSGYVETANTPLTVTGIAANRSVAPVGGKIVWTASAEGGNGVVGYLFFIYRNDVLLTCISSGESNQCTYYPDLEGVYKVHVYAGNYNEKANLIGGEVSVKEPEELTIRSVAADKGEAAVGETITWTADIRGGGEDVAISFFLYKDGECLSVHASGGTNAFSYTPGLPGTYSVSVHAGSGLSNANLQSADVFVTEPEGVRLTGVWADRFEAAIGETITWTAASEGGSGNVSYAFAVYKNWLLIAYQDTGAACAMAYTPEETGMYRVVAYAKDAVRSDSCCSADISVSPSHLTVASVQSSLISGAVGIPVTWTVETSGGGGSNQYLFSVYCYDILTASEVSASNTYTWIPTEVCEYCQLRGIVGDGYETEYFESGYFSVTLDGYMYVISIAPDKTAAVPGETITWTVSAAGGDGIYSYWYIVLKNGQIEWVEPDYTAGAVYAFTPKEEGLYSLLVSVLSGNSSYPNNRSADVPVTRLSLLNLALWNDTALPDVFAQKEDLSGITVIPAQILAPDFDFSLLETTPEPTLLPLSVQKPDILAPAVTAAPSPQPIILKPPVSHFELPGL